MSQVDPAQIGGWHLDKRVPITLIITIAIQTMAVVWWIATTDARVTQLEDHVTELRRDASTLEAEVVRQGREDISISQQLSATNAALGLLRQDVRETNSILRALFNNGSLNGGSGQ